MPHSGISSYQNASLALKTGRAQEAEMLTKINDQLKRTASQTDKLADYYHALSRNQRIWNTFLVALGDADHPYPIELKANLISLGIWVNRHTQAAISDPKEAEALIALNEDVIAGLSARPGASQSLPGATPDNPLSIGKQHQGETV